MASNLKAPKKPKYPKKPKANASNESLARYVEKCKAIDAAFAQKVSEYNKYQAQRKALKSKLGSVGKAAAVKVAARA